MPAEIYSSSQLRITTYHFCEYYHIIIAMPQFWAAISSLQYTSKLLNTLNSGLLSLGSNSAVAVFISQRKLRLVWVFFFFCFLGFLGFFFPPIGITVKRPSAKILNSSWVSVCQAAENSHFFCLYEGKKKYVWEKSWIHQFVPTKYYQSLSHFNYLHNQIINENHTAFKIPLMFQVKIYSLKREATHIVMLQIDYHKLYL